MTEPKSASPARPEISLVSPMYNEGERIEASLSALRDTLDALGRPWEIVLVNDGSTDNSYECAARAADGDERIHLVSYRSNRGRGYAIRQGFARASGDVVVVTESDLSWGGDVVERMVRALEEQDADVVIASPHMPGGALVNVPARRVFLTRFGNMLLSRLMPGGHTMNTGMTRAYRRHVIDTLDLEEDGKEIHLEIVTKIHALGFRVVEVPATLAWSKDRGQGRKSSFQAWRLIKSHLTFGFGEDPILLFGTIGLIEFLLGAVIGFYLFALSLSGTPVSGRPLLLLSVLLILMGILVMLFSFFALQLRDIRRTVFRLQGSLTRLARKARENEKETVDHRAPPDSETRARTAAGDTKDS